MQLSEGEGQTHTRRRSDSCLGWHCLSSATRFGIIFSIVVVFIILSIVWMYCMGKARIFRKQTKPHNASSRQRVKQHHHNPRGTARPMQHIVQRIPVYEYGIAHQAPIYFFSGPQVPTAQPLGVMNAHIQLPTPAHRPQEAQHPKDSDDIASELPKAQEHRQGQDQPSDNGSPSRHPTWWQRFYRAFNLPVGAASTVASSPSPEPLESPQAVHVNISPSATSPPFDGHALQLDHRTEGGDLEPPAEEQDETSSMLCNLDACSDSVQSIRSDVATVHSDDFEMVPQRE